MKLDFTKMQGIGNDFVVIDHLGGHALESQVTPEVARRICHRRFGVGCDQILWIRKPHGAADARMEILNPDGSVAEMCGNGIRAVAIFLRDKLAPGAPEASYAIETLGGVKKVVVRGERVRVDMEIPALGGGFPRDGESLRLENQVLRFFEVSMGNPHAVLFAEDVSAVPLEALGPAIESHPRFPQRTNVEFVQVLGPQTIQVRVWERGTGITLACGTGACASAVAAIATGKVSSPVEVRLPGGTLTIEWAGKEKPVLMEGPALEVFRGEFAL